MKAQWRKFCEWAANERSLLLLFILVIVLRAATLGFPALTDPSEARYATVAQRMVTSGQWLIPEINRGFGFEPFWGKPPLHFWLTACSFSVFGINEWAARLPSFLCSLLIAGLLFKFAAAFHSRVAGFLTALISFSSIAFLGLAGASMTDMTLACCTTGAVVAFALGVAAPKPKRGWALVLFVFLALGMITKGPIALIFPGASIFLWMVLTKRFALIPAVPWVFGAAIFLVIAAPWFVLAESASPGLNKYFFLNENILRFISRDYQDRYGSAHPVFRGAIWLFLIAGFLPWSIYLALRGRAALAFIRNSISKRLTSEREQIVLYLLLWAVVPMCFFTAARSVLFTYVLPSLPPLALFFVFFVFGSDKSGEAPSSEESRLAGTFGSAAAVVSILVLLLVAAVSGPINKKLSARNLIRFVQQRATNGDLLFTRKLPYSADFYAQDGSDRPLAVWLVKKGQEKKVSCGTVALSKKHAEEERKGFAAPKSVSTVDGWELLEYKPCAFSAGQTTSVNDTASAGDPEEESPGP